MKNSNRLSLMKSILALFISLYVSSLPLLATPVFAASSYTWNTQAQFNAGVLNNVDTAFSPNNVVLGLDLNTGNGSDGALVVNSLQFIDNVRSALASTTKANNDFIVVNSTSGFSAGQEVLIIQMTGQGAGKWETNFVAGIGSGTLILNNNLKNVYHVDTNSHAQVLKVPNYTDVTIGPGGELMCHFWNSTGTDYTGGILFFRATGTVTVSGAILASGAGLNGGNGGSGAYGGSGGSGGRGGGDNCNTYPNGEYGWAIGTGGSGGKGGVNVAGFGYDGGGGAQYGYAGSRSSGSAGAGPGGGASDHGGTNSSTANLSLMQPGSGGGGGSSGKGGYGGGGGGGGGYNTCIESKLFKGGPWDGTGGNSGGNPGSGGAGGFGGGLIAIHAKSIVVQYLLVTNGTAGTAGNNGDSGGRGGKGGGGQNWCYVSEDNPGSAGGGGGGGGGGQGGQGGNGGSGGSGGTIWLAADNLTIAQTGIVSAVGGPGANGGTGGSGGSGGSGGDGGSGDHDAAGENGGKGPTGGAGAAGTAGAGGGNGVIRLDYRTVSGSTNPAPGYIGGLYKASGTIASSVLDTGEAGSLWRTLRWTETLHANTDMTFEVRASDILFDKAASSPAWVSVGSSSPVASGLPAGRYMQWRATLTTTNNLYSPILSSVTVEYGNSPTVTTGNASSITANSAQLNGNLTSMGTAATANVSFQWGTTSGGPYPNATPAQAMSAPGAFNAPLSGLSAATTYYYCAMGDGGASGIGYGSEMSFTTSTIPPSVSTNAAAAITSCSATLNGNLTAKGTATSVNVSFQWGTTSGGPYPNSTPVQTMSSTGAFQAGLSGLGPDTVYFCRARADGGANGISYGTEVSFTTSKVPPSVVTGSAGNITSSTATLNGSLASRGTAPTVNVSFQYGTTQGGPYPNSTPAQAMNAAGPFSTNITGLAGNTTYYFKAAGDGGAHGTSLGNEVSFTTSKVPPSVNTIGATNIAASSATLNGQLASMGTAPAVNVSFLWGTDQNDLTMETHQQELTTARSFSFSLSGLNSNTTYYYRSKADGNAHGISYGSVMSFTTSKIPPAVSTSAASDILSNSAVLHGTLQNLGTAPTVYVSFQYGTTSGMYSFETATQALTSPAAFQASVGSLAPNTTYYYRAKANGGIHGISYGGEVVFTTNRIPPAVTTGNASNLTTNSAALNGNLTNMGTATTVNVSFVYGTTQGGPYPNTTASQAQTATGAFQIGASGLSSRTTYYFRAKADGGVNGSAYGDEASFTTGSFPPYVETLPATSTTDHTSQLNGRLHFPGSATTVNVYFVYGTTQGGPYPSTTTKQAVTAAGDFQAPVSGLNAGTTYYYRARADGGIYGASAGSEMSFTTSKIPPSVSTSAAGSVTNNSATLNGLLSAKGDASTVNVSFQWGTTPGGPYPNTTASQAMATTGTFNTGLSGLDGNTTYYFRAKADGGIYGTAYGSEQNFTTSKVPPVVYTDNATPVAATSATLHGFLDSMGTASSINTWFAYGTAPGVYTLSTTAQAVQARGFFQATVTGLSPLTTYYFRAEADGGAHGTAHGAECSFTTSAIPPTVFTGSATSINSDSAVLDGSLHSLGTATSVKVSFQYGTTSGVYTEETAQQTETATCDFTANLSSLQPNTTYYYRAKGDGGANGSAYGTEHSFTTSALPPSVTTTAATNWTTDTAFLNGNLTALGTAATVNVSFIYGTTNGGPYPNLTTQQATTSTGAFQAAITGLSPNTTYYFKAVAAGGIYGTSYGAQMSFTTNRLPPQVSTGGAIDIMTNAATLNGDLHQKGSAATVNVSFEYGTSRGGPYTSSTTPQAMTAQGPFLAQISGLTPDTTYYYRAKGDGGANGTGYGEEHSFTTGQHPPLAATRAASNIRTSSAVLNGDLVTPGNAATVNVSFIYGSTHGGPYPYSTAPQARTTAGVFNTAITGLSAHTAYYYRARGDGGIYGSSYGSEMSFTTSAISPQVTTGGASSLSGGRARLTGNLDSPGSSPSCAVSFQYGTTSGVYTRETAVQTLNAAGGFSSDISGVVPGVAYYYRAKAVGDSTSYGEERVFVTGNSASINTSLGIVTFRVSDGSISGLTVIPPAEIRCWAVSYSFPYGMFAFNINSLTPGQSVNVVIKLPTAAPLGTTYVKCQNGNLVNISQNVTRLDEYTLVIRLTDGGAGDADGLANGTITDPGGPAFPLNTPTAHQSSIPTTPQAPVKLANISVRSAALSVGKVAPGETVTVTAEVANTGTANGAATVRVYVNGVEEAQQGVKVNSGGNTQVHFDITREEPGDYTVYVGSTHAGSFTVARIIDPTIVLFISMLLVTSSLILAVIYIWRRRWE